MKAVDRVGMPEKPFITVLYSRGRATRRIAMQRVYFDSYVYDALIEPNNESIREQLLLSIRARTCKVYGSLTTIEELGGVTAKDTARYHSLIDCFWGCVRTDVLLDRALLLQAEWRKSDRVGRVAHLSLRDGWGRDSHLDGWPIYRAAIGGGAIFIWSGAPRERVAHVCYRVGEMPPEPQRGE
jgi:hypothetical protein